MTPLVDIQNLSKSFGADVIFTDISFSIGEGQHVGLIAKNGTGKSTLLSILTGKEGYDSGKIVFVPGYDITVDTPLTNEASPHRVDHIFGEHERTQARLGVPVLVGEWGGMVPGGEKYPALEHLIDKFDRNRWSQTYWHWFDGMEDSKIMDILSRPYPQAVAGEIKGYGYDRKNKVFTLSYTGSSVIKAPTLIWLPKEPKAVYATRKYQLNRTGNGLILQVYAGKGESVVKVEW